MSADSPRIAAVVINNGDWSLVERALMGVLNQSLTPSEIIILTENPACPHFVWHQSIVEKCPIRLLQMPCGGRASARNFAVKNAKSDYIAFLDAGFEWNPKHLEELLKPTLEACEGELGWVYSDFDEVDNDGRIVSRAMLGGTNGKYPIRDVYTILRGGVFIPMSVSLISRKALEAVGGFDEGLEDYEDEDLFLRIFCDAYRNVFIEKSLSRWVPRSQPLSYATRITGSNVAYLNKLIRDFPDDPGIYNFFTRDFIAPRFFALMAGEYAAALRRSRLDDAFLILCNLKFLVQRQKLRVRLLMSLVLPILHYPYVARFLFILLLPLSRAIVRRAVR